jgi:hypothetical protein
MRERYNLVWQEVFLQYYTIAEFEYFMVQNVQLAVGWRVAVLAYPPAPAS